MISTFQILLLQFPYLCTMLQTLSRIARSSSLRVPLSSPRTTILSVHSGLPALRNQNQQHNMTSPTSHPLASTTVFDVSSLSAVVSGGGSGIGLMIAETLCANGAKVYIIGRRKEALDSVVEQYGSKGPGKIIALPGDISSKEDVKRLAAEVAAKEPKVCTVSLKMFPL